MGRVEEIRQQTKERDEMLRQLVAAISRGREFYSTDVVDMWRSRGDYWVDRKYAFGVVQPLLRRMEAEGVLKSRLSCTSTGERRYYERIG